MSEREKKLIDCPECGNNDLDAIFTNVNVIQSRSKQSDVPPCGSANSCGGNCPHLQ